MNNLLIKLKEELKNLRKEREIYIKTSKIELFNLSIVIDEIEKEHNKPILSKIFSKKPKITYSDSILMTNLSLVEAFNKTGINISSLITKSKNGEKKSFTMLTNIVSNYSNYISKLETSIKKLQNYINAFDNDKVKNPIKDIEALFIELLRTNLTNEEINQIIGMLIYFNKEYFEKNDETINSVDKKILDTLYTYYNKDGSFKYNKNVDKYLSNIRLLLMDGLGIMEDKNPGIKSCRFVSDATFRILLDLSNTNYEKQLRKPIEAPKIEVSSQKPISRILIPQAKTHI